MENNERPGELNVTIGEMTEQHLTEVAQIEFSSFSTPWSLSTFRKTLRDEKTRSIVALVDGGVVGYAVCWVVGDFAELGDIAVAKRWRGRGVGELLLLGVIDICRVLGVRSLFLEVRESNAVAKKLYRKRGFDEIMRRHRYYSDPVEDAIVLGLDIKDR
jgi:ribosomal-protein-alanine N-acetyltransferase